MLTLLPHQVEHVANIQLSLDAFHVAIDTSPTGAGKSFSSIALARKSQLPLLVISPKSVSLVWKKLTTEYAIVTHDILTYDFISSRKPPVKNSVFVVFDEFHYLKNQTKRYRTVLRLLKSLPFGSRVLFLSATPYDKESNEAQMTALFNAVSPGGIFTDVVHTMNYSIPVGITITNGYYQFEKQNEMLYEKGVSTLRVIKQYGPNRQAPFGLINRLIGAGTRDIHEGSVYTLVKRAKEILFTHPTAKVVAIGKFLNHLDFIADELAEFGVATLDGRTVDRMGAINAFQTADLTTRVFVTSAQVGGVGVSLDDQNGGFPRHMLLLPSYETIDLVQCIGRVFRSNTKSRPTVTIIYNNKIASPIQSALETKMGTIRGIATVSLIPNMCDFGIYKEEAVEHPVSNEGERVVDSPAKIYPAIPELTQKHQKQIENARVMKKRVMDAIRNKFI